MIKKILLNDSEHRLRAGWRILFQLTGFVLLLIGIQIIQDTAQENRNAIIFFTASGIYIASIIGSMWLLCRFIDRRQLVDLGFHWNRGWWSDLGFGLFLGAFTLTAVFVLEKSANWITVTHTAQTIFSGPLLIILLGSLLNSISIGLGEELTFRGYLLRNISEGLNVKGNNQSALYLALLLTSLFFGLAHLSNPHATWLGSLNIALAGVLLGLGYVLIGELALPIGLHTAWGFFEEVVYGFPNSGEVPTAQLMVTQQRGPDLWTGGAFGPEAGLLITILILVDCFLLVLWVKLRRRNNNATKLT